MTHPSIHAAATPGKIAYRMAGGTAITYRELDERSNQGAQLFRALGLGVGDCMAILLENCLEFMEICWAAQRAGLYYTAISRFLKADEIAYIIADSGARVLVASPALLEGLGGAALPPELRVFSAGDWAAAAAAQPKTPIADDVGGADMLYSSGTTGRPKGVKQPLKMQPVATLNPVMKLLGADMIGIGGDSVYLSPAPLYHAAPLRFAMLAGGMGATTIIMEKFDAEAFLRLVAEHRVTQSQLVPTMFVRLLKLPEAVRGAYDISSLRGAVHAAAPCPPDVKEAMISWWGPIILEYYGGTEGNGVTIINSHEWLAHRGSVGRALVGEIKIVDDETGEVLPAGEIGSVYFAGGPQFEYHKLPAQTAKAYNAQGWSTLGDVGFLDDDSYLHLTDRKAYMIISGGVNIYPQEAEDVLIMHPSVQDVAVFGVPHEEMGEEVKAIVQPVDFAAAGPALARELMEFCRVRLSPLKCPRSVEFEPELPRTPTGKLLKRLLRDRYWGRG